MQILKHLKYSFWPGFGNSFHPYLLRAPALAMVIIMVFSLQLFLHFDSRGEVLGVSDPITESRLVEETNRERAIAGTVPLQEDERLMAAAAAKAQDMIDRDYWDHYGPDGETPWSFLEDSGYRYHYAGENLAKDFQTSSGVVAGWMNSPEHRENLLRQEYEDVGIATADGLIDGERTTVVVALYGTSADSPVESAGGMLLPAATTYSAITPVSLLRALPLAAQLIGMLTLVLGLVYLGQHLVLRNRHLLWDKHIHPRPLLQAAAMFALLIVLIQSSQGVVG